MPAAQQEGGTLAEARHWFAQNKLKAVGKGGGEREREEMTKGFDARLKSDIAFAVVVVDQGESLTSASASSLLSFLNISLSPPFAPSNLLFTGTFWASSVAGVLAYQWSKPIPTNLKIIHARVAAQALTLGALAAAAAVDFYEHKAELERVGARLDHVEKKVHGVKE